MGPEQHWAVRMFGEVGPRIRERIPEMVRSEQEQMADAQDASGHRSQGVFGQFWRGILEKFEEFGALPGGSLVNPGRAPYRVPVVNGVVLFPWRYGDGRQGPLSQVSFATSGARGALFGLGPLPVQSQLDLDLPSGPLPEERRLEEALGEVFSTDGDLRLKVVVVAIAASTAGVQDITWGEVRLGDGGCLEYLDGESLLHLSTGTPSVITDTARTFLTGEPPLKQLRLQGEDHDAELADGDA